MNLYNYIKSYWAADDDVKFQLNHCCKRIQTIENVFLNKLGDVEDKLSQFETKLLWNSTCIDNLMNSYDYDSDRMYSSPRTSNHSASSEGSNLAVYLKPRIDNHTQLQYVTGKKRRFNTRKRLYDSVDMERVLDEKEEAPRKKIKIINDQLENNGLNLTHVNKNSLIVDSHCNKVRDIINITQ